MNYSVSAVCLDQLSIGESIATLVDLPILDLHCDYFHATASHSLSNTQLSECLELWPRQLTVHLWGTAQIAHLPKFYKPARVLVQLGTGHHDDWSSLNQAISAGWEIGISVLPHAFPYALQSLPFTPSAVQFLTTTTPRLFGGEFVRDAMSAIELAHSVRHATGAAWTIEVDGGITSAVLGELESHSDLVVLGSNYMRSNPLNNLAIPHGFGESHV